MQASLIGQELGDYLVDELVADGPFSWIYKLKHKHRPEWKALKFSKPISLVQNPDYSVPFATQALTVVLGGTSFVTPDTVQLLLLQQDKLSSKHDKLVRIDDVQITKSGCGIIMEWLEGKTLRELMQSGPLSISLVLEIAQSMNELSQKDSFGHHGDLKPENILVTNDGIKLLDPGHFGPLDCEEGPIESCIVTSPSYYPFLSPDDVLALGIMCWEAALGFHPLDGLTDSKLIDQTRAGKELIDLVRAEELIGRHFLTPLLQIIPPSEIKPSMSKDVESFLLQCLRLSFDKSGKLNNGRGFSSFSEMTVNLENLLEKNIKHL